MKFSVLINNYNYAPFLPEALASVVCQNSPPAETLVVDDGSTDESAQVAGELATRQPGVTLITKENGGQLSAIRTGIEAAAGDWCAFLDADDTWLPDHLSSAARAIHHHPEIDVHYSCHRETAGPPRFRSKWPHGVMGPCGALALATGCRVGTITSTIVIRTTLAKKISAALAGLEGDWRTRADDCLLFAAAIFGARFHHDAAATVRYRIHENNHFAGTETQEPPEYTARKSRMLEHLANLAGIHCDTRAHQLVIESKSPDNLRHARIRRRFFRAISNEPAIPWTTKSTCLIRALIPWHRVSRHR